MREKREERREEELLQQNEEEEEEEEEGEEKEQHGLNSPPAPSIISRGGPSLSMLFLFSPHSECLDREGTSLLHDSYALIFYVQIN